jgi:hypothetical protein
VCELLHATLASPDGSAETYLSSRSVHSNTVSDTALDASHGCFAFLNPKVIDVAAAPSDTCGGEVNGLAGRTVEERARPHHSFE